MPLSKDAFDKGLSAVLDEILHLLRKSSGSAFDVGEIVRGLGLNNADFGNSLVLILNLNELVKKGAWSSPNP